MFGVFPQPRPLPNLDLKVVLAAYTSNPRFVPNLKLLASTVAEISRGPFVVCFPNPDTANFGSKCSFLVTYVPNSTCIPNLKLARCSGCRNKQVVPIFWTPPPLAETPIILAQLSCFCKTFVRCIAHACASLMTGIVCFKQFVIKEFPTPPQGGLIPP